MIAIGARLLGKTTLTIVLFPFQSEDEIKKHIHTQCRELYAITGYSPRPSNAAFREGLVNAVFASTGLLQIKTALRSTIEADHIVHEVIPLINPTGEENPVAVKLEEDISKPHGLSNESVYRVLENACGRG